MRNEITILDLFSGIGGFSLGLKRAGFNIKHHYFSEIDKHAIAVYKHNFKNSEYVGSVTDVRGSELRHKPNIITFGSPCQDFSLAGKRSGMEGERSSLILHAIRLIGECRPDFFIWENVKGAFSSNSGADFWGILQAFADIGGYRLEWQLVNTAWVLPQNRERIYLIGHLAKPGRDFKQIFPFGKDNFGTDEGATKTPIVRAFTAGGNSGGMHSGMTLIKEINPDVSYAIAATYGKGKYGNGRGTLIKVNSATKQGFEIAEPGDSINLENPKSKTRKGRVGKKKAQTLNTSGHQAVFLDNSAKEDEASIIDNSHKNEGVREYKNVSPTLNSRDYKEPRMVKNNNQIRRLTPIECERLQGFPDNEKVCIFELWNMQDHQKNNAQDAVGKCHKKQKYAGSVERTGQQGNVKFAEKNILQKNQKNNEPVHLNVLINYDQLILQIHNQKKLIWYANNAEIQERSAHHIQIEDFVLINAGLNIILDQIIHFGKEELHQNEHYLIHQKNGNNCVNLYGNETTILAEGVKIDLKKAINLMNAIMSSDFNIQNSDLSLQTLFYFVIHAIIGFIPQKIKKENISTIQINQFSGWTQYGNYDGEIKPMSDTQRYKQCGNAVTVDIVAMIAKRLKEHYYAK